MLKSVKKNLITMESSELIEHKILMLSFINHLVVLFHQMIAMTAMMIVMMEMINLRKQDQNLDVIH